MVTQYKSFDNQVLKGGTYVNCTFINCELVDCNLVRCSLYNTLTLHTVGKLTSFEMQIKHNWDSKYGKAGA